MPNDPNAEEVLRKYIPEAALRKVRPGHRC